MTTLEFVGLGLAVAVGIYLVIALLKPEWFQ